MNPKLALILVLAIAAACGGGTPTSSVRPSGPSSASSAPSTSSMPSAPATPVAIEPGESIEREQILAAFDALEALDSWTFAGTYWTKGFDKSFEQKVTGTERRNPTPAVDAIHPQSTTGEDFRYIRIGDDIWANAGSREFFHYDAPDSKNLIDQYEPLYAAAIVDDAAGGGSMEFEPVAVETVNGIAAMHYTLSDYDREKATQFVDIEPSLWAGDFWIAVQGGHLVALAWGPQSKETAQSTMGFRYDVTSVNCSCPIEAPETSE